MLRLALLTARTRPGSFAGALLAFAMSAVLVMAGGMLLQAALQHAPSGRALRRCRSGDRRRPGHRRRPRRRARRTRPRRRVADVAAALRARRTGRDRGRRRSGSPRPRTAEAHNWSSARLAPYVLAAGRAPRQPNEIVTGYPRQARRTPDALFDRAGTPGHRRGNRPPAARRARPQRDLPVRYGGGTARRPSRARRCDRHPCGPQLRRRPAANRSRQRTRPHGRCARQGRVTRAPGGPHAG